MNQPKDRKMKDSQKSTKDATASDVEAIVMHTLTETDKKVFEQLPDGWFDKNDVPFTVSRVDYRLRRLHEAGMLKWRLKPQVLKDLQEGKIRTTPLVSRDYIKCA
jgi:predicted DNA-binding ArsR family transcriptional regulator